MSTCSTGLQRFDGEDLNNKARSKYQQEQLREWAEKQKLEREQADANQVNCTSIIAWAELKKNYE